MNFDEYVSIGKKLVKEGNHTMAAENFQAALKIQPDEEIKQLLLNCYYVIQSEALIREANSRIKTIEGLWGVKITDLDTTIKEYSDKIKLNPNASFEREFLGSSTTVLAKNVLGDALYVRSLHALSKKDYKSCIEDLNKAIECMPNSPNFLNKRGMACEKIDDYDQAIADYKKWMEIKPDDDTPKRRLVEVHNWRGISRCNNGDLNGSIADFEACLEIDADFEPAISNLKAIKAHMT